MFILLFINLEHKYNKIANKEIKHENDDKVTEKQRKEGYDIFLNNNQHKKIRERSMIGKWRKEKGTEESVSKKMKNWKN